MLNERGKPRNLYESFGIKEYWVLDPELETIKIYDKYQRIGELSKEAQDSLTTGLLPEFSCTLNEIFG